MDNPKRLGIVKVNHGQSMVEWILLGLSKYSRMTISLTNQSVALLVIYVRYYYMHVHVHVTMMRHIRYIYMRGCLYKWLVTCTVDLVTLSGAVLSLKYIVSSHCIDKE